MNRSLAVDALAGLHQDLELRVVQMAGSEVRSTCVPGIHTFFPDTIRFWRRHFGRSEAC